MISRFTSTLFKRFSTTAATVQPQDTSNKITIREAINRALEQEMRRDKNIFIIGEEVGQYNGAYKVTKGLLEKFGPDRIVDTPITEAGFTGLAAGAALMGLHPVVEFMTMNFALQAIDHIVNSVAKLRYMSAGILSGAIVFRGLNGPAASVAAQHSQCFAAWYGSIPGLITVCPYTAEDHIGLTKMALRSKDPVMILENEYLYGESFDLPEHAKSDDFLIPFGKAKVEVEGNHVTIVAYSRNVKFSLEAAAKLKEEGINAEVINLRSIRPLDRATIINSVKKTHRVVTVEDNYSHYGVGGEIAACIFESAFDELDAPVERLTAVDIPMPYSMPLEDMVTPKAKDIIKGVKKVLHGVKIKSK